MEIFTIGHSTREIDKFIDVLKHYQIEALVDVRHFPRSRHNPQFNKEQLERVLPEHGISYIWIENLGGFRKGGYKNFIESGEFSNGLQQLCNIAGQKRTAVMCAELLWFKCHRRYIADELKRKKFNVMHIFDEKRTEKHKITFRKKVKCDRYKNE